MQSIETRYLSPTDHRESRIKATSSGGLSVTLNWDDAHNPDHNHEAAARALILKMGWDYRAWFCGSLKDGAKVFVCAHPDEALTFSDTQAAWATQSPREVSK